MGFLMYSIKRVALLLCTFAVSMNAAAVELNLSSNASEIPQAQVKDAIVSSLPPEVVALKSNYRIFAVVETSDYKPGERLFSYSVFLHKRITEAGTGKQYWVNTGGVRGHGVAVASETILSNMKSDMKLGGRSFKLDQ